MQTSNGKIRIVLHDEQDIFREGIVQIIRRNNDFEIVAISENNHLLTLVEAKLPDVVITSFECKETDMVEATRIISEKYPHIAVLIVSLFHHDQQIIRMLKAGAKGCLLRNAHSNEVHEAIRTVSTLGNYYSKAIIEKLAYLLTNRELTEFAIKKVPRLSQADQTFIKFLCQGHTMKDISTFMNLSVRTLEHKKEKLYLILGKQNVAGLINFAIINGLYNPYEFMC